MKPPSKPAAYTPRKQGAKLFWFGPLDGWATHSEIMRRCDTGVRAYCRAQPLRFATAMRDGRGCHSQLSRDWVLKWLREYPKGTYNTISP